jgi:transcriptional regulator NrdR family protein
LKCPMCGAWSDVLETRTKEDNTKRRRYECGNLHRFTTLESVRAEPKNRIIPDRANRSAED